MLRPKDEKLNKRCAAMAQAAHQALGWFGDNSDVVGSQRLGLERAFKRNAVEANVLARAAARPMSVGVFGASQSGKSFLVGRLIAQKDNTVPVTFGNGEAETQLDFLTEVNPQGGKETTGLVTRFTVSPVATPDGYPVSLRLLTEADLVKIFANSFLLDMLGGAEVELSPESLREMFEGLRPALAASDVDALRREHIYDLREYVENALGANHPMRDHEDYWSHLEHMAPLLPAAERAQAYAPLWGGMREFTELFLALKRSLDNLGHPEFVFARIEALRQRSSILHVDTLGGLDLPDDDEPLELWSEESKRSVTLPKSHATALTSELRVRLQAPPWAFLEHTDLLDFPGARSRMQYETVGAWRSNRKEGETAAYCFLRGKVAVLFDKFTAELDLNTMVLCIDERNQEVAKLSELVTTWVERTQGSVTERAERRCSMFLCLTKSDTLFDRKAGASPDLTVRNRLEQNFKFLDRWVREWSPGTPFRNVFFLRNPGHERRDLFDYDEGGETGQRPDAEDWIEATRKAYVDEPLVQLHVPDAGEKWDSLMTLNDGGISLLAERLGPACDPDLKYEQILPRAAALAESMRAKLELFYEGGDLAERLRERIKHCHAVAETIARQAPSFGPFLRTFQVEEPALEGLYLDLARGARNGEGDEAGEGGADMSAGILVDLGELGIAPAGGSGDARHPRRRGFAASYADAAMSFWQETVRRRVEESDLPQRLGIDPVIFGHVINELQAMARRLDTVDELAGEIERVVNHNARADEQAHVVALRTATYINNLATYLGSDRGGEPVAEKDLFRVGPRSAVPRYPDLPSDAREMQRRRGTFIRKWLEALVELTKENVQSSKGGLIDIEQNEALGGILALIETRQPADG